MPKLFKIPKTWRKHFAVEVVCYEHSEEVKMQSKQRTSCRFMTYVTGTRGLSLKSTRLGRRYGKSEESQKLKKARNYSVSAHKHNCGTIVERHLRHEQYQKAVVRTRIHADWYGIV